MLIGILATINFISAFIQGASGFGYAIFAMFLMPLFLDFHQCSVLSAAVIVAIALQMTFLLRDYLSLKKILWPMFFCLLFTPVGIWLIQHLQEDVMRKIMGIFLIFLAVYFYYTDKKKKKWRATRRNGMIVGILTGISTGMFNIVGPFLTLYYFDNCDSTLEFKANLECSFLAAGLLSFVMNLLFVPLSWFLAVNMAVSAGASLAAGVIGLKIYRKLDQDKLKYVILATLPLMGVIQLIR